MEIRPGSVVGQYKGVNIRKALKVMSSTTVKTPYKSPMLISVYITFLLSVTTNDKKSESCTPRSSTVIAATNSWWQVW